MMKRRSADRFSIVILVVGGLWIALSSIPLSWFWYSADSIYVADGQTPIIDVDRTTRRKVNMRYTVTVRRALGGTVVCEASSNPFTYHPDSMDPDIITLRWWAPSDARCANLSPGSYELHTCWTAKIWILPDKTECVTSNVFTVTDEPVGKPRSISEE